VKVPEFLFKFWELECVIIMLRVSTFLLSGIQAYARELICVLLVKPVSCVIAEMSKLTAVKW